jgi:thiamine biosynthesis protein ThiI
MLLVRYAEIGLKGKNRGLFEAKLIENIKRKLGKVKVEMDSGSILVHSGDATKLREIFGVSWFATAVETGVDIKEMQDQVLKILEEKQPKTFRLTVNRSNKKFPIKSQDLAREIGKVCEASGFEVKLKDAELEIFIDVLQKRALVYLERFDGLGGLPMGTSGKVLCLLSGGIDSPVAAYLMAKRGCSVDYLHFYALRNADEVRKSKITRLVSQLQKFCGDSKLFLVPFLDFQMAVLKSGQYELQLFRRFMLKLAEKFADENGYEALVLGDNLNQVASQTLSNINAVQTGIEVQIFRPLLTFDKHEIISLAEKIGTFKTSTEDYKDCCSIIVKKPKTRIGKEKLLELEEKIKLKSLIDSAFLKISN